MAKYGSQLRYPYVMLELMNSWDEDQLSNCESVLLLKTIKSEWANGLTKNVSVKCKLNYVGYSSSRVGAHSAYYIKWAIPSLQKLSNECQPQVGTYLNS